MQTLSVNLGANSYKILIGSNLLGESGYYIKQVLKTSKVMVISNSTIFPLYGDKLVGSLENAGLQVFTHIIPDGEEYKNISQTMHIIDKCIEYRLERSSAIIAIGGGVIGDIAGFAAAIYQRGIPFIQIPTSLLAQVDSSVGGKVAINHPLSKNMIGAFHQPKLVIADTDTLHTLDERDYVSGLGEVCKYGIIYDLEFFNLLEENTDLIKEKSDSILATIINKSCQIKSDIVTQDEKEIGLRAILNLGHTFGHAIESISGYGRYRHGEAVIMGIIAACNLAVELNYLTKMDFNQIINLFKKLKIYQNFPNWPAPEIYRAMLTDKKVSGEKLTFILPQGIGNYAIEHDIPQEKVIKAINTSLAI